jgi:hypothetical protein
MATDLFREHMVWRRLDNETAARYTCIEHLQTTRFRVQSCDFFYLPLDDDAMRHDERQRIELLIQMDPNAVAWFISIDRAIEQHDRDFEN